MNHTTKTALGMAQLYRKNWDNPDAVVYARIINTICNLEGFESVDRVKLFQQLQRR